MTCPLTPGRAYAIAALIDTHPHPLPHWAKWAEELLEWGRANDQNDAANGTDATEERSEKW